MNKPIAFRLAMIIFTVIALHVLDCCLACNSNNNPRKQLKDVKQLTFNGTPSLELTHLTCLDGGAARCELEVNQIICENTGLVNANGEIKWNCRSPHVKFPYRFGLTKVVCKIDDNYSIRPDVYFQDEKDFKVFYTVEYVGDIFTYGLLLGMTLLYGYFLLCMPFEPSAIETTLLKSILSCARDRHLTDSTNSEASSTVSQAHAKATRHNLQDGSKTLVNLENWTGTVTFNQDGRDQCQEREKLLPHQSYPRRGPHSIGTTRARGRPSGENWVGGMAYITQRSFSNAEFYQGNLTPGNLIFDQGDNGYIPSSHSLQNSEVGGSSVSLFHEAANANGIALSRR